MAGNKERNQEVWRKLEAKGWSVIIVWECQLKKANREETIDRVAAEIVRNGEACRAAPEERNKAREEYRRHSHTVPFRFSGAQIPLFLRTERRLNGEKSIKPSS